LQGFFKSLEHTRADIVSLIFLNFQPEEFPMSPRPSGYFLDVPSLGRGLQLFSESVAGSLEPANNETDAMWSLCDWAMLSCSRVS
jgi:hypothetical protein